MNHISKVSSSAEQQVHWLYIDMNSFFASCEQQKNPELRGKPVGIVPSLVDSTSILAASYEAKAFGVKTGVKVGEARKMCRDIQFVVSSHNLYVEYHHLIHKAIETCVPIEKVCSVDEYAIRLTGTQKNLSVAIKLAEQIKKAIREKVGVALTCSIGISVNRYLAKVAADMKKPDGLTVISQIDLPHKLYSLKLQDLPGIGPQTEIKLRQKGIRNIQDLISKNEQEMNALWGGIWGGRMCVWLQGRDLELTKNATASLGHEHVLPPQYRNYSGSWSIAKRLLNKAADRLRKSNYFCKKLHLTIRMTGFNQSKWEESIKFDETRDTISLLKHLDTLWKKIPQSIQPLQVSITLSDLKSAENHQYSFFENPKLDQLSLAVDKINQRFGKSAVHLGAVHEFSDSESSSFVAFNHIPDLES